MHIQLKSNQDLQYAYGYFWGVFLWEKFKEQIIVLRRVGRLRSLIQTQNCQSEIKEQICQCSNTVRQYKRITISTPDAMIVSSFNIWFQSDDVVSIQATIGLKTEKVALHSISSSHSRWILTTCWLVKYERPGKYLPFRTASRKMKSFSVKTVQ